MWQVLFRIPIKFDWAPDGIPIYGFGMMLFLTYFIGVRLAVRRAKAEGVDPEIIQDLAIWLFIGGIVARATYLIAHEKMFAGQCGSVGEFFDALWEFIKALPRIWDGGIILYGSVLGTLVTWGILWLFIYRKRGVTTLQLADIYAPSIALGVCLGRLGCLCNGCCYGQVACESCPGISFPLAAAARYELTSAGLQTAAGFSMHPRYATVSFADPNTQSSQGLERGDVITHLNGHDVTYADDAKLLIAKARLSGNDNLVIDGERGEDVFRIDYSMRPLGFTVDRVGGSAEGPTVRTIDVDNSAYTAGLRQGDRILGVAGDKGNYRLGAEIDLAEMLTRNHELQMVVLRRDYYFVGVSVPLFDDDVPLAVAYEDKEYSIKKFSVDSVGFTVRDVTTRVGYVAPDSPADKVGKLKRGDVITKVNEEETDTYSDVAKRMTADWTRGENELRLEVKRKDKDVQLAPFEPRTIPLHPTQLYESISMFLMFLVLLAYTPLRTSYGQVLSVLAIGYAIHRYLNEWLRNDVRPGWFELGASVVILIVGVGMYVYLWYYPLEIKDPPPVPPEPPKPEKGPINWKFWQKA